MANVIIDSSTFGMIASDKTSGELLAKELVRNKARFSVCNFKIIRDELRKAPRPALDIYDTIVSKNLIQDSKLLSNLAKEYFVQYQRNGGGVGKKKILNDFKIVACASVKNCDLIFSDDERTLKSKKAIDAYRSINLKNNYRTPTFYRYSDLKKKFLVN